MIGALDAKRFQPWFDFYPSGVRLERIAEHLTQLTVQRHAKYGFDRLFVVAHSMGGLVARAFNLHHADVTGEDYVRLLVSISTPWNGHAATQKGVEKSPVVIDSWIDVAPDSDYIRRLFYKDPQTKTQRRRLSDHVFYHLLFGFKRNRMRPGASSDRVVTVASKILPEPQQNSDCVFGLDEDHRGILRSETTAARSTAILDHSARLR